MKKIAIINGPNLNLLGKREPELYGKQDFDQYFDDLKQQFSESIELYYFQSNIEGELIDKIQELGFEYNGIILNAGGYTHTSVSIRDAISAINTPVLEVHISNVYAREQFRHLSLIAPVCKGCIAGFGLTSYLLAVQSFLNP